VVWLTNPALLDRAGSRGSAMDKAESPGDGQGDGPGDGEWLSVNAAAKRLGVTPRAIRNRIERDTICWRPAGNHGRQVLLNGADSQGDGPGDGQGDPSADLAARCNRAEGELAGLRQALDELRTALAVERARGDRLELALGEARKGWLERVLEAVRRR
jgi:hypothetical protein